MFTLYVSKESADKRYKQCNKCTASCPANCMWSAVLANGGEGNVYCTVPDMDNEERVTRYGM